MSWEFMSGLENNLKYLIFITVNFFIVSVNGAESSSLDKKCDENIVLTLPSAPSEKLINQMKNVLGITPLLCRDNVLPTDDQNDIKLKAKADTLILNSKGNYVPELDRKVFNAFKLTLMKKLWSLATDKTKTEVYYDTSCSRFDLNKWPVFTNKKSSLDDNPQKEKIIHETLLKICRNNINYSEIAPYLTKDIVTESVLALTEAFPTDFKQVHFEICGKLKIIPELVFKDENYENFVLGQESIEDINQFAEWFRLYSQNLLNITFQKQKRVEEIVKILTPEELLSIQDYTASTYFTMNSCLRNDNCDTQTQLRINNLMSALKKIKAASANPEKKITFRGISSLPDSIMNSVKEAVSSKTPLVIDKGFISTSGKSGIASNFSSKIRLVIRSKSCVGISEVSLVDYEDEFLCPPGMKFKVYETGVERVFRLEEDED
jgi:hypothetical protein